MMKKLEIENQTIYFKSSESMDDIKSNSVTLVVTSPPYWNAKDYGYDEQIGFGQSYKQYIDSLNNVWKECIRVLQPNGKIAINLQPLPISAEQSGYNRRVIQNIMFDIEKFMRENDMHLSGMHYWDKAPYVNNVSWGSYPKPTNIASNTSFEQIFVWVKRGDTRKIDKEVMEQNLLTKEEWRHWAVRCIWDDISPVIKINSKGENIFGHSAPFPEDIPYRLIRMHTVKGEHVLDPFLGSGTTLKICRLLNRKGIGFELNPDFENLIKRRIQELWTPPKIEREYTTIGSETFKDLLYKMIRISRQNKTFINDKSEEEQEEIIKKQKLITKRNIQQYFKKANIFNDAFIEKIGFKKKKKKEQTNTIDTYFENGKNKLF